MRLSILHFLYSAATRVAAVAYFVRAMLGVLLRGEGACVQDGEFWYREWAEPFGTA